MHIFPTLVLFYSSSSNKLNNLKMNFKIRQQQGLIATVFLLFIFSLSAVSSFSQTNYTSNGVAKTTIVGTSNIHDWEMISDKGNCTMTFQQDAAGVITGMSNLNFSMNVNTLKSKHGSTMDNNAYKAIGAEKYPTIKFAGASGTVKSNGANSYTITAPGKLTISSGTKDVTLTATCKVNPDKSLSISGSYKLKTTDYNVKAISIMLGAIKTSPDVTINYNMSVKPQ
jgi:polyisoprenoid-binding protein YceI